MYETIIFMAVVLLTQFIKAVVFPRWGNTGVHILTFVLALIGVGIYQWAQWNASVMEWLIMSLNFLVGAIAVYEIILSKIGFKDTQTIIRED